MARVPVKFGPNSDSAASTGGGGSFLENCFVEPTKGGKTDFTVLPDPGLVQFSVPATGQLGRGMYVFGNVIYSVQGETLYSISVSGTATSVGALPGSLPVNWAQNLKASFNQIVIVTDSRVYWVENGVLTQITDPDLPSGVHSVCHLNGFIFYGILDKRIFSSNLLDCSTINALNFDTAQKYPDRGVRVYTVGEEVWYFGSASLEIFRYIGGTGFPLERLQGASHGEGGGCAAKNSVLIVDNAPFWINDKRQVVRAQGYTPMRVSTSKVERDIETAISAGLNNQITAFAYAMNGHQFYAIRCSLWCWVYDAMTQEWHKKTSYGSPTWNCGAYVYAFGTSHIVQDFTAGILYTMALGVMDEAGQPLIMKLTSEIVHAFPNYLTCSALYIDAQGGTGLPAGAGDQPDPQIIIRVSRDGGKTFGFIYQQSTGQQADFAHALILRRMGLVTPAGMVVEVSFSSPVERAFFQAAADVKVLSR